MNRLRFLWIGGGEPEPMTRTGPGSGLATPTQRNLGLPICLGMVCTAVRVANPHNGADPAEELRRELGPVVRQDGGRCAILEHPVLCESDSRRECRDLPHRDRLSKLTKAVRDN